MKHEDARRLLDRVGILRSRCDLDLLQFFVRHPRTLITSEQLATWLGYDLNQIADSLEVLLGEGLLTRTLNPAHAAQLYVFAIGGTPGGWLPPLLELASTREGRLAIVNELARRKSARGPLAPRVPNSSAALRLRPFMMREKPGMIRGTKPR